MRRAACMGEWQGERERFRRVRRAREGSGEGGPGAEEKLIASAPLRSGTCIFPARARGSPGVSALYDTPAASDYEAASLCDGPGALARETRSRIFTLGEGSGKG